eukprot:TRINITY_DN48681_c0_g1_i1.p1 TRINITY_DN48681_c0_g1~~TRINITY_DN48681_c0_g1_i1.p1  ORF type:complete len:556 (+),score=89.09 TRINITY_DN48681_c0_g1_i1:184-1851(+)
MACTPRDCSETSTASPSRQTSNATSDEQISSERQTSNETSASEGSLMSTTGTCGSCNSTGTAKHANSPDSKGKDQSTNPSENASGGNGTTKKRSSSDITAALKQAQREKRRLLVRIKIPALMLGGLLMGGTMGWISTSWTVYDSAGMFIRDLLRSLGCVSWLCACLPTDRVSPKVGCLFLFCIGLKCFWFHATNASNYMQHMEKQLAAGLPCSVQGKETDCYLGAFTILSQTILYITMHLWQLPYLLYGLWLPPRATNARQWFGLALLHFTKGASDFLVILPAIAIRSAQTGNIPWLVILFSLLHGIYATGMGGLLASARCRHWVHFTLLSKSGALTAAASIAGFIGNKSPQRIVEMALSACRYVSLDKVTREDMKKSTPDIKLQAFSTTCHMNEVDVFLSHSWHDCPDLKWEALQMWRAKFKKQHGREPRVWIDKYCIDQANIEASLMCLPVFLAGCQSLLILAGSTYLSRLWCLEEVFVYLGMGRAVESIELIQLEAEVQQQTENFDVQDATCFLDVDREMLLATIEAGCDGFEGFNQQVRQALNNASKVSTV